MDGNGNKVQTLRQQFEKSDQNHSPTNAKYPSILKKETKESSGGRDRTAVLSFLSPNVNGTNKFETPNKTKEDIRRTGIYVRNSVPLPEVSTETVPSSLKRRPMVLDLHRDETFMEELEKAEGTRDTDDLSVTSSGSSTCVNLLTASNENDHQGQSDGDEDDDEGRKQNQAVTPTSSSSGSTSGYGKVKRSNAFRAKEKGTNGSSPTSPTNNSVTDSHQKSKLVLERVKSLDSNGSKAPSNCSELEPELFGKGKSPLRATTSLGLLREGAEMPKPLTAKVDVQGAMRVVGKAVNVVTPYQVSDIYNQISKKGVEREVEYAVPIISRNKSVSKPLSSPPKIPPPPQTSPPSVMAKEKEQHGIPNNNISHNSNNKVATMSTFKGQNVGQEKSGGSSPGTVPPPEKPPRTFLYDILTDHRQALKTTTTRNGNELYMDAAKKVSPSASASPNRTVNQSTTNPNNSNPKRQYSSSSSSSTLTSSTTSYVKQPQIGQRNISVSTATVRQTNKAAATNSSLTKMKSNNGSGNNKNETTMAFPFPQQSHPPLTRSKTESQLTIRSRNSRNDITAAEIPPHQQSPLNVNASPGSNYDYGYKLSSSANNNSSNCNNNGGNTYYSPPHHHRSQNVLSQQSQEHFRLYDAYDELPMPIQSPYRSTSTTNLLAHKDRRYDYIGLGTQQALYSSPFDHGLPPPGTLVPGHPQRSQLQQSRVYPNHNHNNHGHISNAKSYRSNSLMYMTDISLEGGKNMKGQTLRNMSIYNNGSGIHSSVNQGVSSVGARCSSDDRLCERSKSEWALNLVPSNSRISPGNCNESPSSPRILLGAPHRRNTVTNMNLTNATHNTNNSGNNGVVNGGNNNGSTGHPSLESTSSSSNVSSANGHNGHGKKPGIQQSIQNLVNQLFSTASTMKDATSSTDSGIQLGSESLSSCDTPVGDSTTDTGDSDCENDTDTPNNARQVVEARKGYVRRVSSIRVQELGASINRLIQNSKKMSDPLFECLLIVGLNRDPYTGMYHAYIRDKFPPNAKLPSGVEQFCFPDSMEWPCHEGLSAQFYTLAITDQRGSRKFGCCYRILPEGANICIPITYCIISSHRAIGFYREVLRELTLRHGYSEFQKRFWMEELYKKQFPVSGGTVTVTEPIIEDLYQSTHQHGQEAPVNCYSNFALSPTKTVSIKRRADHRLDEGDLVTLMTTVDLTIVIKTFGSLLLERKVVLISRALSTLSLCVEAFESLLFPFSWQHTFVPILPLNMTDVLDAPAPFVIGVLRSSQTPWDKTLDEGIVVDLDGNKIISCVGDEGTILPKRIHRKLRDALQLVLNLADQKESTKNVLLSEVFIRMFVETMGHHAHHIVVQQDGMRIFERESFVKASDSKAVQNFLEWFSETSMFHEFTQLRLKNPTQHGLFEQRVMEQCEQHPNQPTGAGGTPLTLKNAKMFMNKSRPFGNWFKDAFVK